MAFLSFPHGWPWDAPPPPPASVRTYGRSYADVITKFSRLDGLPIFLTNGASLARFARWSSATNLYLSTGKVETLYLGMDSVLRILVYLLGKEGEVRLHAFTSHAAM